MNVCGADVIREPYSKATAAGACASSSTALRSAAVPGGVFRTPQAPAVPGQAVPAQPEGEYPRPVDVGTGTGTGTSTGTGGTVRVAVRVGSASCSFTSTSHSSGSRCYPRAPSCPPMLTAWSRARS